MTTTTTNNELITSDRELACFLLCSKFQLVGHFLADRLIHFKFRPLAGIDEALNLYLNDAPIPVQAFLSAQTRIRNIIDEALR